MILSQLFINGFLDIFFTQFLHGFQTVFNMLITYKIHWFDSSEHLVLQTLLYSVYLFVQLLSQLSSLTIVYSKLVFNASSITLFFPIPEIFRTPSHHTVLWRLHSSPFPMKYIFLQKWLVWLVSLTFLYIHTAYLLSNMIRVSCSGTAYG